MMKPVPKKKKKKNKTKCPLRKKVFLVNKNNRHVISVEAFAYKKKTN